MKSDHSGFASPRILPCNISISCVERSEISPEIAAMFSASCPQRKRATRSARDSSARDSASRACCMNSSHGKPFQFSACFYTGGMCRFMSLTSSGTHSASSLASGVKIFYAAAGAARVRRDSTSLIYIRASNYVSASPEEIFLGDIGWLVKHLPYN